MTIIKTIVWHHGTCDLCKERNILVCHFGYDQQEMLNNYRICKNCLAKNIEIILFGRDDFKDGLID